LELVSVTMQPINKPSIHKRSAKISSRNSFWEKIIWIFPLKISTTV